VNTPVNAISAASEHHLRDKLVRLSKLISGQPVELGCDHIVASAHPEGIAFCKNLLAKKFVVSIMVTVNIGLLSFLFRSPLLKRFCRKGHEDTSFIQEKEQK
jgi:hypothetical protein